MALDPHHSPGMRRSARNNQRPGFLYQTVLGELRSRMARGVFTGGSKLPGLKKIAAEFDVSIMTVRRALSVLEQEGHIQRMAGVGVFARPGRQTEQGGLAFVSTFLNSSFQTGIANGTRRAGQQLGRPVSILDGHFDVELEMKNVSRLPNSGIVGAVVLPPFRHPKAVKALQDLYRDGFPMVVVDMALPGVHTDFVTSDHETAAYDATAYLLSRRNAPAVFLTHPPVASSVLSRIQGYERALRDSDHGSWPEHKVWIDAEQQATGFDEDRRWWGGYTAVMPVLRDHPGPLSVLATDSYAGWGVYEACRELGLRIPEDVSVISFDDTEFTRTLQPPMTVVRQSLEEIGQTAVELLMRRLGSQPSQADFIKTFNHVVIGVRMIERSSVCNWPISAENV